MPQIASETASASLAPHRRIVELDALRAMAAINLVLFHFTHVYEVKFGYTSPLGWEWPYGAYGVEMFFILSGFVNSMSLLRRRRPADFLAARFIRIVPIFVIAIFANLWILTLPPHAGTVITPPQFAANLTLMPNVFGHPCIDPVLWTLQIEMMFYGVLTAMFRMGLLKRYFLGWGGLLAASLILCPLLDHLEIGYAGTVGFALATAIRRLLFLDFVPLFMIGFLLYQIQSGTGRRWQNLLGIAAAAAVFHSIDHGKHNPAATALIIAVVTAAAYGRIPVLRLKPFVVISTLSYAIYLFHNNLGCALIHRFNHSGWSPNASLAIAIAFSLAVGVLVTKRIEQPITRRLREAWRRWHDDSPTAVHGNLSEPVAKTV